MNLYALHIAICEYISSRKDTLFKLYFYKQLEMNIIL